MVAHVADAAPLHDATGKIEIEDPWHLVSASSYGGAVRAFRIGDAADLLGVSTDTVRRWIDAGRLPANRDEHGHRSIAGPDLAAFAVTLAGDPDSESDRSSARNRLRGIVTAVVKDAVMAQVDIQAGPFRVVSLMSREAVDDLDLQVGSVAVAVIKSTTVVVERDLQSSGAGRGWVNP
jgi:molybdopterin-binding protein